MLKWLIYDIKPLICLRCGVKFVSFGFACDSACGRSKAKCAKCGLAKNFKFFRVSAKKLKHEAVGCLVGKKSARWSVFIPVFLMSFGQVLWLSCRSLRLQVTFIFTHLVQLHPDLGS